MQGKFVRAGASEIRGQRIQNSKDFARRAVPPKTSRNFKELFAEAHAQRRLQSLFQAGVRGVHFVCCECPLRRTGMSMNKRAISGPREREFRRDRRRDRRAGCPTRSGSCAARKSSSMRACGTAASAMMAISRVTDGKRGNGRDARGDAAEAARRRDRVRRGRRAWSNRGREGGRGQAGRASRRAGRRMVMRRPGRRPSISAGAKARSSMPSDSTQPLRSNRPVLRGAVSAQEAGSASPVRMAARWTRSCAGRGRRGQARRGGRISRRREGCARGRRGGRG